MGNLTSIENVQKKKPGSVGFLVGTTEFSIPLSDKTNVETELKKLNAELEYQKGFSKSVMKKTEQRAGLCKMPSLKLWKTSARKKPMPKAKSLY